MKMNDTTDLARLLQQAERPWWRRTSLWLGLGVLAVAAAGIVAWRLQVAADAAPRYVTQPVARGNLAVTVSATGTLQPTRSVAVGSELSGTVARVFVDVNDRVKRGQQLVVLDTAKLADAVRSARAEVDAAAGRERVARATLAETRAQLARLQELARISGGKLPAATELDSARAAADRAAADVAAAQAAVAQARAGLSTQETNLSKASIKSPIDGIVLARNVEPGNAVAASLQAVTLFTLAEDLTSMVLSVAVDEADVGQLREGQGARFTVAAQPGREYPATVTRVAYGSTTTDNVVTYTTQLQVANPDLTQRPGMTATATIATTERRGVLLVPNSALRFSPTAAAAESAASNAGIVSRLVPRPPRMGGGGRRGGGAAARAAVGSEATLWVLQDGKPAPLRVRRGPTDGRMTEVTGAGVAEGLQVIVDQVSAAS